MNDWQVRREQFRQARAIHGGALPLSIAALGVRLSRVPIPTRRLREWLYRSIYGRKYPALDERELDRPLHAFRSLNALFTRGVRPEFRPIADGAQRLAAPCDGVIQACGHLSSTATLRAKGIEYSLESLLPGHDVDAFRGGAYAIVFLSPADCHRVFAPDSGDIARITHVPGGRLLVHPPFQRREFPVFTLNERVLISLRTEWGEVALALIAGWGVGHITLNHGGLGQLAARRITDDRPATPRRVARGEWIATFELGSTVILLTPQSAGWTPAIASGQRISYGQPLMTRGDLS